MIKKILFLVALILMVVGCSNPTNTDYEIVETPKEEKPQDNTTEETTPNDNKEEEVVPPVKEDVVTLDTWRYNGSNLISNCKSLNLKNGDTLETIKNALVKEAESLKKIIFKHESSSVVRFSDSYSLAWNVESGDSYKDYYKVDTTKDKVFTNYKIEGIYLWGDVNIYKRLSDIESGLDKDSHFSFPIQDLDYCPIIKSDTSLSYTLWKLTSNYNLNQVKVNDKYIKYTLYKREFKFSIDSDGNLVISENFVKL